MLEIIVVNLGIKQVVSKENVLTGELYVQNKPKGEDTLV